MREFRATVKRVSRDPGPIPTRKSRNCHAGQGIPSLNIVKTHLVKILTAPHNTDESSGVTTNGRKDER